ncbi:hypothetical protein VC83_05930 [Pseudogymnoascus destructans]|uniref:Uncharacterized protein n=1 Tax=Pseudogymnoascus destructans TaxID=655981 RepID=A0A177A4J8_9PEZI|nr:uncharacterized protein VC83_05930 [Pseudogymnoascus destructans]OAF57076.1 hypothetical protein VC83_05930 [Pseudogymnoascus destructans]
MSLIINQRTRSLWETAQTRPEWAATRFWEYVLKGQFFIGDDWAISSQQPPTDDREDRRRVDLRIERWKSNRWQIIALFEAKKQNCSQTEVDELEHQAYNACMGLRLAFGISPRTMTISFLWCLSQQVSPILQNTSKQTALWQQSSGDGFNYMIQNDMISADKLQVLRSNCSPRPPQPPVGANSQYLGPATQLTYGSGMQPSSLYPANPTGFISPNPPQAQWPSSQFQSNIADTPPQPLLWIPPQVYTVPGIQDNNGDEEDVDGDNTMESPGHVAELDSETAIYVDVTRKVVSHMTRPSEVFFCFENRQTTKKHWRPSTIAVQGAIVSCVVYTSSKGTQYYTYALPKAKGKGKA